MVIRLFHHAMEAGSPRCVALLTVFLLLLVLLLLRRRNRIQSRMFRFERCSDSSVQIRVFRLG